MKTPVGNTVVRQAGTDDERHYAAIEVVDDVTRVAGKGVDVYDSRGEHLESLGFNSGFLKLPRGMAVGETLESTTSHVRRLINEVHSEAFPEPELEHEHEPTAEASDLTVENFDADNPEQEVEVE